MMQHGKRMSAPAEKARKGSLIKLVKALKPYAFKIVLSFLFIIVSTVLSVYAPQWLSKLTDEITANAATRTIDMDKIMKFAVVLIVFYGTNALCNYFANFIMTSVTQKYARALRSAITEKINRVPLGYFDAHQYGDTLSVITNDVDTMSQSVDQAISMLFSSLCMLVGVLIAMFVTSWKMALTVLLMVPLMLVIIMNLFQSPMSQLAQSVNSIQTAAAAASRVYDFLGQEELSDETGKPYKLLVDGNTVKGNVEFKNVRFGYSPDKIIIPDFSASVKAGMKVAIVGPTGAGKTTLVNLLMRFYEIDGGDITIDGVSVKDMPRSEVHDIFGMVLQDTWMFEGTVRENILFSKDGVDDAQLEDIMKEAGISHYVHTLPGGLDYFTENESNISGGQKQLITIARAMAENSPLLILDEATSNVDTRTEEIIQTAMDKLTEGRTSFVIAHRLSTIKNADMILVMRDGNIVEQGNHDELIAKNGFYAGLYNSQFANE